MPMVDWKIPEYKSDFFMGRHDVTKRLKKLLPEPAAWVSLKHCILLPNRKKIEEKVWSEIKVSKAEAR